MMSYCSSSSGGDCEPSDDQNRTTRYTYTRDGLQATLTAVNAKTGDQTTTWTYGTTLVDSDIASPHLLRSLVYPDSTGGSDVIAYRYNRQGERTSLTDQRGCVHQFEFDLLGRQIHDRVTTVGSGVDDAVLRLSTTYEVRGMVESLTSWDDADVESGDAVNQCLFFYNGFQQLIADFQEHDGQVDESTPVVQYDYEDGSNNTIRPTALVYPNGRELHYSYGTSGGIHDALSRICSLIDDDGTTHLADYSFVGLGQFVVVDYTEPSVKYTLVNLSGTNDPDTGDIYSGWDRFGRVKDCRWYDYGHSTDVARLKYGYDRASDRLWRADLVAQSLEKAFDELYTYDGLRRLKDMQRGLLNGSNTAITDETFAQCWSLDSTSNWHGFREASAGGAWTTVQARSANTVNEITDITNSVGSAWVAPAYDAAGNTTTIPQPADPTTSYTATYDAWNRMVGLTDDSDDDDPVQQNVYDARNFRVTRFDYAAGDLDEERHFYYTRAWRSIEERLRDVSTATLDRQYIWGQRYIDDLVLRDRDADTDGEFDEREYGLQDASWNVIALLTPSADVDERCVYSLYGQAQFTDTTMNDISATSSVAASITFTGQTFDAATHLHAFRNRFYNCLVGTFTVRDVLQYVDGPSLYSAWFVPRTTDPSGHAIDVVIDTGYEKDDAAKSCKKTAESIQSKAPITGYLARFATLSCAPPTKIICKKCTDKVDFDAFFSPDTNTVVLCADILEVGNTDEYVDTLAHELIHAVDNCICELSKTGTLKTRCQAAMCFEMRAASCSSNYSYKGFSPDERVAAVVEKVVGYYNAFVKNKLCGPGVKEDDVRTAVRGLIGYKECYCDRPCTGTPPNVRSDFCVKREPAK